jgi:hypothetical protein
VSRSTTSGRRRRTGRVAGRPGPVADREHRTDASTVLDDPDVAVSTSPESAERMCRIIAARAGVDQANAELRAAVRAAREAGDSWATIAAALDTARGTSH